MNPLSTIERIAIQIVCGVVLIAAVLIWWHVHNLNEQKAGASACIQGTTETKTAAVASNAADAIDQGDKLAQQANDYETKLKDLRSDNADLALRLRHANPLRASAVSGAGCAAIAASPDARLPASESAPADRSAADTEALFNACDANQLKTEALAKAYNDWRARMIAENATRAAKAQ
jgi:hypothetical protein